MISHKAYHYRLNPNSVIVSVRGQMSLSLISVVIPVVNTVIQLCGFSDITEVWDPGLGLWRSLWIKIEGSYVHLSFNVMPFCMYILVVSLMMGLQTFLFGYPHHQVRSFNWLFNIDLL